MASFAKYIRLVLGALAFLLVVGASAPSNAQQVNPTASSVKELQLLQELNRIEGRVSIPDERSGVLEQPAGRDWREFRNVTLRWIGGVALLGGLGLFVVFFFSRGIVALQNGTARPGVVPLHPFLGLLYLCIRTPFSLSFALVS